jgi:hypothetical protein
VEDATLASGLSARDGAAIEIFWRVQRRTRQTGILQCERRVLRSIIVQWISGLRVFRRLQGRDLAGI